MRTRTPQEARVLLVSAGYLVGLPESTIALGLGVSPSRVSQILGPIKTKLDHFAQTEKPIQLREADEAPR